MSGLTVVVTAFVLGIVAMAFAFSGGAVIVAVPLAIVVIAIVVTVDFSKRRRQAASLHEQRDRASSEKVQFTERDEQTLVSE